MALHPDLRAVELLHERHAQPLRQLEASERSERVALIDEVGAAALGGADDVARVGRVGQPAHEVEDPPDWNLREAGGAGPERPLRRIYVDPQPVVRESVDHAGGMRGGAADVRTHPAQGWLDAQVCNRPGSRARWGQRGAAARCRYADAAPTGPCAPVRRAPRGRPSRGPGRRTAHVRSRARPARSAAPGPAPPARATPPARRSAGARPRQSARARSAARAAGRAAPGDGGRPPRSGGTRSPSRSRTARAPRRRSEGRP